MTQVACSHLKAYQKEAPIKRLFRSLKGCLVQEPEGMHQPFYIFRIIAKKENGISIGKVHSRENVFRKIQPHGAPGI